MFETYRMLARERHADFEREAEAAAQRPTSGRLPRLRHSKWLAPLAAVAVLTGAAVALGAHVMQVDPATVPTGFLAAHNSIAEVPVAPFARAVNPNGGDFSVQHVRLGPNAPTGWHTHPGPAFVTVVKGSLTYEDACKRATYGPGSGFVDRGFGHVHRAIAGPEGVDFYVTYVLPAGSETHVVPAAEPTGCRGRGEKDDRPASSPPVTLEFEKHAVSVNSYVGTLAGGGTVDMLVLDRSSTSTVQRFRVLLRVDRGDKWLGALADGTFEFATGKTTLAGKVSFGNWLEGAQLKEEGQLAGTSPLRFTGTLTFTPAHRAGT